MIDWTFLKGLFPLMRKKSLGGWPEKATICEAYYSLSAVLLAVGQLFINPTSCYSDGVYYSLAEYAINVQCAYKIYSVPKHTIFKLNVSEDFEMLERTAGRVQMVYHAVKEEFSVPQILKNGLGILPSGDHRYGRCIYFGENPAYALERIDDLNQEANLFVCELNIEKLFTVPKSIREDQRIEFNPHVQGSLFAGYHTISNYAKKDTPALTLNKDNVYVNLGPVVVKPDSAYSQYRYDAYKEFATPYTKNVSLRYLVRGTIHGRSASAGASGSEDMYDEATSGDHYSSESVEEDQDLVEE